VLRWCAADGAGERRCDIGRGYDLLIGEVRDIGALTGVLDGDSADVAISIYVSRSVFSSRSLVSATSAALKSM
jgi:hypothetical protein